MKIYINEKEIVTEKTHLFRRDFLQLNGDQSLCPPEDKYNIALETSNNYWEDQYITEELFEIKDNMKFKVFPKASTSQYGPFI